MGNLFKKMFSRENRGRTASYLIVIIAYIVLEIMRLSGNMTNLLSSLLVPVCCYITAAIALNLNVGFSGELNLGQGGFMGVGAFTAVVVSGSLAGVIPNPVIRLILAMIAGAVLAGAVGWLIGIPVLKLQGDYLAIVTLAFGQIIKSLITNLYVGLDKNGMHFSFVDNHLNLAEGGKVLISGPMGATGTERIATFTAGTVLILIALTIVYNLIRSRHGRAIMAARDNRIAAESVGIHIANTKMLAVVISAALAGAAGALFGLNNASLAASKFDFNLSILILVYVVLGGLGNLNGTIIATTVLVLLPELLRSLQDYRMLIYAVILIVIMLVSNNEKMKTGLERLRRKTGKGADSHA